MIFKIKMMSGTEIPVTSEEELANILEQANAGKTLIVANHGIINIKSIDSITKDKKAIREINELKRIGKSEEDYKRECYGLSPFKKLLDKRKESIKKLK